MYRVTFESTFYVVVLELFKRMVLRTTTGCSRWATDKASDPTGDEKALGRLTTILYCRGHNQYPKAILEWMGPTSCSEGALLVW